eukprot:5466499-Pyramimonas_sp.AAC.1
MVSCPVNASVWCAGAIRHIPSCRLVGFPTSWEKTNVDTSLGSSHTSTPLSLGSSGQLPN